MALFWLTFAVHAGVASGINEEDTKPTSNQSEAVVSVFHVFEETAFVDKTSYRLVSPPLTAQQKAKMVAAEKNRAVYQCVVYVRMVTGNPKIKGTARDIPVDTQVPSVGAVVKTSESSLGHVAIVKDIDTKNGYLILSEANLINSRYGGPVVEGRKLAVNSPKIVGYIVNP